MIPTVYEDEKLLIVDKPQGLLTIPAPGRTLRTLTAILNDDLKARNIAYRLHPCHRLDRETSGLLIYAKGKSAQKKIMDLFRSGQVKKTYIAFVQGNLKEPRGRIDRPLEGARAVTDFRVLESRGDFSIVEIMPQTGKTNQIRIHFKAIGHPLVGETKFAFRRDYVLKAKRVCLHAQRLEFIDPWTHKKIKAECRLAGDLQKFLEAHGGI